MNKLIAVLVLCLAAQASAREVAGVKLDSRAQLADANLLLNGAGVRTKLIFDIYVAALYLDMKTDSANVILDNTGPKRMTLVMKRDVSTSELLDALNKGIADNVSPGMLEALSTSIRDFSTIFAGSQKVSEGDVIMVDYVPGFGTRVSINGELQGHVGGGLEFYSAFLGIWLGKHPVDDDLKDALLGY